MPLRSGEPGRPQPRARQRPPLLPLAPDRANDRDAASPLTRLTGHDPLSFAELCSGAVQCAPAKFHPCCKSLRGGAWRLPWLPLPSLPALQPPAAQDAGIPWRSRTLRSTRRRRSIRCRISASTGRTWRRGRTTASPMRPDTDASPMPRPSAPIRRDRRPRDGRGRRGVCWPVQQLSTLETNRDDAGQRRADRPPGARGCRAARRAAARLRLL